MDPSGKVVVITGAGRGIGRALAQRFAALGSQLALIDLREEDLRATCALLGAPARPYVADVSVEADVVAAFERIASDFGRLDVLVNNAGITKDALLIKCKDNKVIGKMTLDQWQAVINVNLTGTFLCAREAAEKMAAPGGGVIINISSVSRDGNIGQSNYSAAKAGVIALTVTWAKELARYGIRVGAIAPGFVKTDLVAAMRPDALEKAVAPVPLKRLGLPGEIAHAVQFIVESDFFTGRCIAVDGGLRI